jgi:hypothetical protein
MGFLHTQQICAQLPREGSQRTCEGVHPTDALERRARPE